MFHIQKKKVTYLHHITIGWKTKWYIFFNYLAISNNYAREMSPPMKPMKPKFS